MKFALIIPDGCADEPQAVLGGKTPLGAANIPHMDRVARDGFVGQALTVPESLPPGSDVGTMSLFGYDPLAYHTGRAPIEAAAQGIELAADDWAIRCNLVTVTGGVMESFTAHQVSSEDAAEFIELLQRDQCGETRWKFHAGVSYRNLLIHRARKEPAPFSQETQSTPPHDIIGRTVADHLPSGPGSDSLRALMQRSEELFHDCPTNQRRADAGLPLVTSVWLWGLGCRPDLEQFANRFGKTGAVITAVDLLRGMARLTGLRVIEVPGATGYTDTDYAAKGRFAIDALQDTDLIIVHVEATDEASHEGDADAKVRALENIDRHIVGPLHEHLKSQGRYRLLISPDHPTFLRTKTHSHGAVPFAMCGTGISPDPSHSYTEAVAANSEERVLGHQLMPKLVGE